jgi:hypothetical protein
VTLPVQYAWNSATSAGSLTVTLGGANSGGPSPGPTTAGNCLAVVVQVFGGATVSSLHLGGGADNFAKADGVLDDNFSDCEIWTDQGCAGAQTSVVITLSGSAQVVQAYVIEWPGLLTTGAVDKTNHGTTTFGTSWSSGSSGTLSQASEVVIGAVAATPASTTTLTTPGGSWTELAQLSAADAGETSYLGVGYQSVNSTAALTYSGTTADSSLIAAVIVTLKAASPPSAPGTPPVPPSPFTPMSLPRYWQPPPAPFISGSGRVALAPLGAAGTNVAPTGTGNAALRPLAAAAAGSAHSFFPSAPLGTVVELLINGVWTDITSYVQYNGGNSIKITGGRPDETQSVTPAQCTLRVLNTDGRFSPSNTTGAFAPYLGRNTQFRVSVNVWVRVPVLSDVYSGTYLDTYGAPVPTPVNYEGFRFWGECSTLKPGWDETGGFRYVDITASGPLRRYSQGNATIGSALRRYYVRLAGSLAPYGYWPAEDAAGATEFASYAAGVPAMGFTGSPQLGSDSSFGGSDPLPAVNSSSWHGQTLAASSPPGAGSITQITPGTYEWTCPPGVTAVTGVTTTGAGGGGGAAGPHAGGGGGGGGGLSAAAGIGVTAGVTYQYVVGAGGRAGVAVGAGGTAGGASSWTGDTQSCTGGGGQGGQGGDTSAGGGGGTGTNAGGAGGTGQSSITTSGSQYFSANTGATGGASGGTANPAQASFSWTAPAGVTTIQAAVGGGAGGGAGGGQAGNGTGGGGGGGGGLTTATVQVVPLTTYSFLAGNGGNGGNSASAGQTGGDSVITGGGTQPGIDTSITAAGGSGGSSGSGGTGGAGDGPGNGGASGSAGGGSVRSEPGEGMGGGGGGGGGGGQNGTGGTAGTTNNPKPPGAGGGNGSGGGWGATSNGGTGATNGGTGRAGSVGSSGGGGGGGGGAVTNSSGNVGGGGGAGWAYWSWSVTAPAGGGGGGGGGSSSAGSAGGNDGTGGAGGSGAVPGGQGGFQGAPSGTLAPVAPGGGGGGGVPASATTTAAAAANGAAGQVSFAWSGGAISPVAADIIRFPLKIDAAGGTDGTVLARAITYGTVERLDLIYHTASGGSLELIGYNSGGTVLFDSGTVLSGLNGTPVMADIELTANGSGGATWSLAAIEPGAGAALGTFTGTVTGVTVSNVSDVYISPNSDVSFASAGHVAVQTYADPLTTLATVMAGYSGELAETRLARLCAEEGLAFTLAGPAGVTPQMQAQQDDTFPNVIQSCEDADRGLLTEARDSFGLRYRSRVSMQGQTPALTMDYSLADVAYPLQPATDDQYTRNDIALTRNNGSSARAVQQTGPMSVLPPEQGGVGDYLYTLTTYVLQDSQLANMAAWMLIVGTVADERFPVISIDMSRPEILALFTTAAGIGMGDYLQIVNPPSWLTSAPVQQLAWGVTETLSNFIWRIDFNAVPESPYSTGSPPSW